MMSVKMDTKLIWDFWYINRYIIVRQFRSLIRVVNPFWTAEANPGTASSWEKLPSMGEIRQK